MKGVRNASYRAIAHVFGDNLLFVIAVLMAVGWFGDTLLQLFHYLIDQYITNPILSDFVVFLVALSIIFVIYLFAATRKSSDKYIVSKDDEFKENKKILIFTLSPYSDYSASYQNTKKDVKDFERIIPHMPSDSTIDSIRDSEFNCNWAPLLNTIQNYPNLTEIIVITTDGERGSHGQAAIFRQFVDKFFSAIGREFSIKSHINTGYIEKVSLIGKNQAGAPSNELNIFAETVLDILDNIEKKHSKVKDIRKQVVVDVTGGTAAMSAVLGAVTSSKDLFLHYTDTNDLRSNEIDISAS